MAGNAVLMVHVVLADARDSLAMPVGAAFMVHVVGAEKYSQATRAGLSDVAQHHTGFFHTESRGRPPPSFFSAGSQDRDVSES